MTTQPTISKIEAKASWLRVAIGLGRFQMVLQINPVLVSIGNISNKFDPR